MMRKDSGDLKVTMEIAGLNAKLLKLDAMNGDLVIF